MGKNRKARLAEPGNQKRLSGQPPEPKKPATPAPAQPAQKPVEHNQ